MVAGKVPHCLSGQVGREGQAGKVQFNVLAGGVASWGFNVMFVTGHVYVCLLRHTHVQ